MGDVNLGYNPEHTIDDLGNFQMTNLPQTTPEVEVIVDNEISQSICDAVDVARQWESLANKEEHSCLQSALMQMIIN